MLRGIVFKGRFYPLMGGGSGEDASPSVPSSPSVSPAEAAPSSSSLTSSESSFTPENYARERADLGDEWYQDSQDQTPASEANVAPDARANPAPAPDPAAPAWLTVQPDQAPQLPQTPQPASAYEQHVAQLQYEQQMTDQLVQAHLVHLQQTNPAAAQQLVAEYHQDRAQRQLQLQQLQLQAERAQLEKPAREIVMDRLVNTAAEYTPAIDRQAMRDYISKFGDGTNMLTAAQEFVRLHREGVLQVRAKKGTDKAGNTTPSADLANKSVTELLSMGYRQNATTGKSRRFRSL